MSSASRGGLVGRRGIYRSCRRTIRWADVDFQVLYVCAVSRVQAVIIP